MIRRDARDISSHGPLHADSSISAVYPGSNMVLDHPATITQCGPLHSLRNSHDIAELYPSGITDKLPVVKKSQQDSRRTYEKSYSFDPPSLATSSDQEAYKARAAATKPTTPPDRVSISLLRLRDAAAPVDSAASSEVDEAPDSRRLCQHRLSQQETGRTYQQHQRQ